MALAPPIVSPLYGFTSKILLAKNRFNAGASSDG